MDRVNGYGDKFNQISNAAADVGNRAQNAIDGVDRGINNAVGAFDNLTNKTGELFSKASSLTSNFKLPSNPLGGSDLATTQPSPAAGSGNVGVSPSSRIAGFAFNPKDTLPSIDPLKREVAKPFEAVNAASNEALDYLQPNRVSSFLDGTFSKMKDLRDSAFKSAGFDYHAIKQRVEGTMKMAGQLAKLPGEIRDEVNNYVYAFNSAQSEITAFVGDTKRTFDNFKDLDNYLGIDNFINQFRPDDMTNMDYGSYSGVIFGVNSSLSEYGMAYRTEDMVEAIKDPAAKAALYGELLVQAAGTGNLESIEFYVTKMVAGQGQLLANDVIKLMFSSVQTRYGDNQKILGERILKICTDLDPNWDKVVNKPTDTLLDLYTYCNSSVLRALTFTDKRKYVIAATGKRVEPVKGLVEQFFPL
ncbi:MAG: hypothetical protein ACRDBQ_18180 [Shewanella sp.]